MSSSSINTATTTDANASSKDTNNGGYKRRDRLAQIKQTDNGKSKVGETLELKGWVRSVRSQRPRVYRCKRRVGHVRNANGCLARTRERKAGNCRDAERSLNRSVHTSERKGCRITRGETIRGSRRDELEIIGKADPSTYPLQKKRHTLEYLRGIAHLRPRTNTIAAVSRVRNQLAFATHQFFQQNGLLYVNTPIITASDCEGAGEQFQVTCLLNGLEEEEGGNK